MNKLNSIFGKDEEKVRGFFREIIDYTVGLEVSFLVENYATKENQKK